MVIQLGDIGDIVWAIPAFCSVSAAFPQAALSVLTRKPNGDLLLDDHNIKNVFQIGEDGRFSELRLIKRLRQEKFDLVFDLRADDRGAITAYLSGAKIRAGLYYPGLKWRNLMFTHLVQPAPAQDRIRGAAEQSLKIIRGFGIEAVISTPRILVTERIQNTIKEFLLREKIESKIGWVSINPFSRWTYKEWSTDKWRQLALFVWQKYEMPILIIGSAEEKQRADELASAGYSPMYNIAGQISLRDVAGLLQRSILHIGVDSAAPHIAAAVGTPTLTIYGPSDWQDWSPPGDKNKVVLPDMDCSPCYQKGCHGSGRSECLENLTVTKVQNAVEKMIDDLVLFKS